MGGIEMQFLHYLPDWLSGCFRIALLGEIYSNIRAIVVGYDGEKSLLIRYYLDRQPADFDFESINIVAVNFDALGGKEKEISRVDVECIWCSSPMSHLEPLSGFVYSRREENP